MATQWKEENAISLRKYLADHPEVIAELERRIPAIKTDATIEVTAMSGAIHAGAEKIISELKAMANESVDVRQSGFIDPTKD